MDFWLADATQSATDALKTTSKRAVKNKAEANGDLIRNKIADKFTRISKTSPQNTLETNAEILREKYISPELRQNIDDARLKEDLYNNNNNNNNNNINNNNITMKYQKIIKLLHDTKNQPSKFRTRN